MTGYSGPLSLSTSPWIDLVYHGLSLLPIDPDDASRLHSELYTEWVARHIEQHRNADSLPGMSGDADILALLYDRSPGAHLLHGFADLHTEVESFLTSVAEPFETVQWRDPEAEQLSLLILERVPLRLVELFRVSLWSEAQAGYLELHEQTIVPAYRERIPQLAADLETAASVLAAVRETDWVICHPLRRHGRLLSRRRIAIGLPDDALDVPRWAPVMQGCHELLLSLVLARIGRRGTVSTRSGEPEFQQHAAPEIVALSLGAALFSDSELAEPFTVWLDQFFPEGTAGLVRFLPWTLSPAPRQDDPLLPLLASGRAVSPEQAGLFTTLRSELTGADPAQV